MSRRVERQESQDGPEGFVFFRFLMAMKINPANKLAPIRANPTGGILKKSLIAQCPQQSNQRLHERIAMIAAKQKTTNQECLYSLIANFMCVLLHSNVCTKGNISPRGHGPCRSQDNSRAEQSCIRDKRASQFRPFRSNRGTLLKLDFQGEPAYQTPYR